MVVVASGRGGTDGRPDAHQLGHEGRNIMPAITITTIIVPALFAFVLLVLVLGLVVIGENETGLVIKRFGKPLPQGRLIALHGEAGFQARMLPPGWHFGLWSWQYKIQKVPLVVVPPGEIA